jgi:hypothetical protein
MAICLMPYAPNIQNNSVFWGRGNICNGRCRANARVHFDEYFFVEL